VTIPVVMPQLGESIVEATLVHWRVEVGARVERGAPIADVETDKATSELLAPATGRLTRHLVEAGTTVDVGTPVAELEAEDAAAPRTASTLPAQRAQRDAPTAPARPPDPSTAGRLTRDYGEAERGGPPRHSPAVRRLARMHGIDLDGLVGSGRNGRVTRDDLLAMVEGTAPTPIVRSTPPTLPPAPRTREIVAPTAPPAPSIPPPVAREQLTPFETALPSPVEPRTYRPTRYVPQPDDEIVPFTRRRMWIAEHMVHSLGVSAHVATVTEIDMSRVARARADAKADAASRGFELTYMPYIVSAVADALAAYPELNATVLDEQLVLRGDRNIGIAVDTSEGLAVFVVKRADELGLFGIARAMHTMAARARAGALEPDDTAGGSFTISNPGKDGNLFGVSIIRQPEVGILRIGAIVKRPVVRQIDGEDAIVIRPMMYACLSYDHRVIDGRTGNAFLSRIASRLATWGDRD
jgi:2-oxoglutarate dehydrogenase E2 component (dihydrolipoamide succinyltransferase)